MKRRSFILIGIASPIVTNAIVSEEIDLTQVKQIGVTPSLLQKLRVASAQRARETNGQTIRS